MPTPSTLQLQGTLKIVPSPSSDDNSANPTIIAGLLEQMSCNQRVQEDYVLSSDSPVTVSLGGLAAGAQAVMLKVLGGSPVTAVLTSAADVGGANVPVDPFAFVISQGVPFTGITIQRATGILTTVRVVLASI